MAGLTGGLPGGLIGGLLAAPFIGSFLGVLIRRLPRGRGVVWGRSACEACGATLGVAELVPVVSFLASRGRCRRCGARIARAHLAVELASMAVPLSAWCAGVRAPGPFWSGCGLGWALLALGWIDAETFLLPDVLSLPLVLAGLAQCAWLAPDRLADRALAAIVAYGALRLVAVVYRRVRGQEGLGEGDAKLLAAGGAWCGLAALPTIVLAGALLGLATAGVGALRGQLITGGTRLPFGPALAGGIWIVWLVG